MNLASDSATPNEFRFASSDETADPYIVWNPDQEGGAEQHCVTLTRTTQIGYNRVDCTFRATVVCETKGKNSLFTHKYI